MEFKQKIQEGQELLNNITKECWRNEKFKNRLIDKPVDTIEAFLGKKFTLQANRTLKIEDQTNNNYIYLNIPKKINIDNLELTDEELDSVSGGFLLEALIAYAVIGLIEGGYAAYKDSNRTR